MKIIRNQPQGTSMLQRLLVLLIVTVVSATVFAADSYTLSVWAGDADRIGTPVSFTLPDNFTAGYLSSEKDQVIPLHISGKTGTFILDSLPANKTATYKLNSGVKKSPIVNMSRDGNVLKISAGGKPILTYQGDPMTPPAGVEAVFTRGGYIHPVHTPSGKLLTD